jgi:hypothetical protein
VACRQRKEQHLTAGKSRRVVSAKSTASESVFSRRNDRTVFIVPSVSSGMSRSTLRDVVERQRVNAILAWLVIVFLLATATGATLAGDPVWAVFVLSVAVLGTIPPVATRHPTAMLPWEVLLLAALPALGRTVLVGETLFGLTLTGRITTFLAVAAVALVIAVELDVFTPVRMNEPFAVFFVTLTTTAAAGVWALARYLSDTLLGTRLLFDGRSEHVIETALMWDFVAATFVGLLAGVLFELYFRRRSSADTRVPSEVSET